MSWISVTQSQTTQIGTYPELTTYTVHTTVTEAQGIEPELFVLYVDNDQFCNVALIRDLQTWPTDKAEARAQSLPFYRVREFSRVFTDRTKAAAFSSDVQRRLRFINRDWGGDSTVPFGGDMAFVYSSETP